MGSHNKYIKRYPEQWNTFEKDDYPQLKESQKNIIASYDNSILYNDYVVSEILKCFESTETLAIYFSDHGQDLFNSSENYFGHGIKGNTKSEAAAIQIPFFVYMSRQYQENFPVETELLKMKRSEMMNTDNTIEFICEILNVTLSK